jgi:hypothetical protein
MKIFTVSHVEYVYDELFHELVEFCRLGNEYVDDLFQRVMHIYCRFIQCDRTQVKKSLIGFHISFLFLKGTIWIIKLSLIHKSQI